MKQPQNPFGAALRDRRPRIGLWLALADAYWAEIVAGFVAVGTEVSLLAKRAWALRDRFGPDNGGRPAPSEATSCAH